MTGKLVCWGLVGLLVTGTAVCAADPTESSAMFYQPPSGQKPPPRSDQMPAAPTPPSAEDEGETPGETNPHMIGDFPGLFTLRTFFVPVIQNITTTQTTTTTALVQKNVIIEGKMVPALVPVTTTNTTLVQRQQITEVPVNLRVAVPDGGSFKLAENESPRPVDRVFVTYNYYSGLTGPDTNAALPHLDTVTTTIGGAPTTIATFVPGVAAPREDLHREVIGFEKTFLNGDASIGMRVPFIEQNGVGDIGDGFGDVTVIFKYAFINDRTTGNVLSGGLAVTAPTGHGVPILEGELHSTLLQPWMGFIRNYDRWFIQGFTSVVIPTDWRDVLLLFNDVGVGYTLYQSSADRFISTVAPTLEAHVTTPLNHRDETSPITVPDLVVLTAGSHFGIYRNSTLTVGVATPLTGPRLFDIEALVQFNWRF
jgi:hypothetical protein